jgi:thioredoxin-related protein
MVELIRSGIFIVFTVLVISLPSDVCGQAKMNWMTWDEVAQKNKTEPKKILIDLYTDWCTFCKKMDEGTMCQDNIIRYINENYYPIKFNAETREIIEFNSKTYKYVKSGRTGYNELALELTQGKLSYPAIIILDEDFKIIQAIHGYMPPQKLEMVITYFSEDHHKKTPWINYQRRYVPLGTYTSGN